MKKKLKVLVPAIIFCVLFSLNIAKAQMPANALVGYLQNWSTLKLSQVSTNYNVICLAFALPVNAPAVGYDLRFALPAGYTSVAQMTAEIDALHLQGRKVILSIGGATGPIVIASAAQQTTFVNSINTIFTTYGNKIDGLDLDLETSSMSFAPPYTITSPNANQTFLINAILSLMATYQTTNGKKMLLTMAPETNYVQGGMSSWAVANNYGGSFLPVIYALRTQLDLLFIQLYNSGGGSGGTYAWNGTVYYDTNPDYLTALTETMVKGFTCLGGLGTFPGLPASKLAFGLPASTGAASDGYVTPANVCLASKYFKGTIAKPAGWAYTMTAAYPTFGGLMTWSVNYDAAQAWAFANAYSCAFPLPVSLLYFNAKQSGEQVNLSWATASEKNSNYFEVQKSVDGKNWTAVTREQAAVNSNMTVQYRATDNNNISGIVYYRLMEVDIDGNTQYSEIQQVDVSEKSLISVKPNPNNGDFNLTIRSHADNVMISLTNTSGQHVFQSSEASNGFLNKDFNFGSLAKGMYFLTVVTSEDSEVAKIIIE